MAKEKTYYTCKKCGFKSENWMGRCTECGAWNSFIEQTTNDKNDVSKNITNTELNPYPITEIKTGGRTRYATGIDELDRVLGGGIVSGSLLLLGGAPGIGKSTLILQVAFLFSDKFEKILYISGEESVQQIKLRAERINTLSDNLYILSETNFAGIKDFIIKNEYGLVIIDSIQTVYDPRNDASPGSISQIKEIAGKLLEIAKKNNITIIMLGHVTKEGSLAGPKVLEHLVDTVLHFEGDSNYTYRILRSIKNRYGSTNEIGVFTMKESGIEEVANPSQLFIEERPDDVPGSVIVPVIEGSRTILVEIQALISSSAFASPRRLATGVSKKRISILLAVLEKRAGFNFQDCDAHLNIIGGLRVDEPALDLGIVVAIISSMKDYALPSNLSVVGEIGLAGEIRAVNNIKKRLEELRKLGFKKVLIPEGNVKNLNFTPEVNIIGISDIEEVMNSLFH